MLTQDLATLLREGCIGLGVAIDAEQEKKLLLYVVQLMKWNSVYNLTAVRDAQQAMITHILDCMAVMPTLARLKPARLLDVGSGAGLPGVPIAVMFPDVAVTSVDAVQKKIAFQMQIKGLLNLPNFTPIHARVEALTPKYSYNCIVSRAFSDVTTMLTQAGEQLAPSGMMIAMKGEVPTSELASLPGGWRLDSSEVLTVPFLHAQRSIVLLEREPICGELGDA